MTLRPLLAMLVATALVGCGQAPVGTAAARLGAVQAAAADQGLKGALAAFTRAEGRKVTARKVKMNEGRGAAELAVSLSPEDQTLLVQLYRLHPRAVTPDQFPAGLVQRAAQHLATLHGYQLPAAKTKLAARALETEMRTRVYRDGDGKVLAYEAFLAGDDFQLFGKYDLAGKILKVDIETWQ